MELQTAQRKRAKIKMALQGHSGSGKTYSALLVAHGLCQSWEKVAVIDTENESSHLYAHLGGYKVLGISAPFEPEKYIEAIDFCVASGIEVVVIDSLTHEWECLLDYHSSLSGNSFTNWNKVTPRHNAFVQKILQAPVHIIATIRTKQDYVLTEKNGKTIPEKVGLKSVQRDGLDYEFTLVFDLDNKNLAHASKDRTGLFFGKPEHRLSATTGNIISKWCMEELEPQIDYVKDRINNASTIIELLGLYNQFTQFNDLLLPYYEKRKQELKQFKNRALEGNLNPIQNEQPANS
jgi:hypothetical protein